MVGITVSPTLTEGDSSCTELALGKSTYEEALTKLLAGERAGKATLVKVLEDIVPKLEQLTKRVDEIARTPLPPLTIARNTASLSKQQDGVATLGHDTAELSTEAVAAALSKMSKQEQTLTLIKASYAHPIRVLRSVAKNDE